MYLCTATYSHMFEESARFRRWKSWVDTTRHRGVLEVARWCIVWVVWTSLRIGDMAFDSPVELGQRR